jgi:hypothetical protein
MNYIDPFNRSIRYGDLVIVYERHDNMKAVTVSEGSVLQNRFGWPFLQLQKCLNKMPHCARFLRVLNKYNDLVMHFSPASQVLLGPVYYLTFHFYFP